MRINKTEAKQFIKFTLFSVSAGIIQLVSFTLFKEVFHWNYWVGYLIAITLSVLYNFTLNRKFTFKSACNVQIAMLKVAAYYVVFTPVSDLWGAALTGIGWNEYLVLAITMVINFVTEFFFQKYLVFRKSKDKITEPDGSAVQDGPERGESSLQGTAAGETESKDKMNG